MIRSPAGVRWACIWARPHTRAAVWQRPPCSPCGSIRPGAAGISSPARGWWPRTCPRAPGLRRGSGCARVAKVPGSRRCSRAMTIRGARMRIGTESTMPSRRRGGRVRQPVPARIWWRRGGRSSAGARRRPPGSCAPARIGRAQAEGAAGGGSVRTRLNSQRPPPKSSSSERIEARLSVASAVTAISVGPSTAANFPSIL